MLAIEVSISSKVLNKKAASKVLDLCHKLHVQNSCGLSRSDGKGQTL